MNKADIEQKKLEFANARISPWNIVILPLKKKKRILGFLSYGLVLGIGKDVNNIKAGERVLFYRHGGYKFFLEDNKKRKYYYITYGYCFAVKDYESAELFIKDCHITMMGIISDEFWRKGKDTTLLKEATEWAKYNLLWIR